MGRDVGSRREIWRHGATREHHLRDCERRAMARRATNTMRRRGGRFSEQGTAELGAMADVRIRGSEMYCRFGQTVTTFWARSSWLGKSQEFPHIFITFFEPYRDSGQDDVQYASLLGRRRINRFIVEQRIRE